MTTLFVDYALDPETNDLLAVGADGGFPTVDGIEAFAQRLRIRFRFLKNDWFLDPEEGIPLVQEMMSSKVSPVRADALMRQVVESTPGFLKMLFFESTVDPVTRKISVKFQCVVNTGDVVDFSETFVIE